MQYWYAYGIPTSNLEQLELVSRSSIASSILMPLFKAHVQLNV